MNIKPTGYILTLNPEEFRALLLMTEAYQNATRDQLEKLAPLGSRISGVFDDAMKLVEQIETLRQ